tara:strand:- start:434 stop:571 length:138 start_codon:yes stop_codon:yes gene_type:complete
MYIKKKVIKMIGGIKNSKNNLLFGLSIFFSFSSLLIVLASVDLSF